MHFADGCINTQIVLLKYVTITINHSSLKNQVRHQTRNQFLIFDDSTFLKWSHTLTLREEVLQCWCLSCKCQVTDGML